MIWALLGFSVVVAGLFYLIMAGLLIGRPLYEGHRILFVAMSALASIILWFVGHARTRQLAAELPPLSAGEEAAEQRRQALGLSLGSLQYWAGNLAVCSVMLAISCAWRPLPQPTPAARPRPPRQSFAVAPPPKLKLQGLLYKQDKPAVIIGGSTYYEGDFVAGAKILHISREAMEVRFQGATTSYAMPR
jgi:hypothetical protein